MGQIGFSLQIKLTEFHSEVKLRDDFAELNQTHFVPLGKWYFGSLSGLQRQLFPSFLNTVH